MDSGRVVMPAGCGGRLGLGLIVLAVSLSAVHSARAEEPLPALQDVLQRLTLWRSQFRTVRIVSRSWNRQDFIDAHPTLDPDQELGVRHFTRHEFLWADTPALRTDSLTYQFGKPIYRTGLGDDGQRVWHANSKHHSPTADQWSSLRFSRPDSQRPLQSGMNTVDLAGLWNQGAWVDQTLREAPDVQVAGREEIDGHVCVKLQFFRPLRPASNEPDEQVTFWLDPELQWLPRQRQTAGTSVDGQPGRQVTTTWVAREFQLLNDKVWFPVRGDFTERGYEWPGFEWVIDKVELNPNLPTESFSAPTINRQSSDADNHPAPRKSRPAAPRHPAANPAEDAPSYWFELPLAGVIIVVGYLLWRRFAKS